MGYKHLAFGLLLVASGCVRAGMLTDGTSVSYGYHSRGILRGGAALPVQGDGYVVPETWRLRQRNFGTDELVELLIQTSQHVKDRYRGSVLGVADLSPRGGGRTLEHLSHHSGRDVDLILYARSPKGRPLVPRIMTAFDAAGRSVAPNAKTQPEDLEKYVACRFDRKRNWALIKALVTHPEIAVQWVFLGAPLIELLLEQAKKEKAPQWLIERAATVLRQPGDAQNHMDHMHVRIFCPPSDRQQGCVDRGPPRWLKKTLKYHHLPEITSIPLVRLDVPPVLRLVM
jgi:penicillin-insensitive murein endopeptidase